MKNKSVIWIMSFALMIILPTVTWPIFKELIHIENIDNADEVTKPEISKENYEEFSKLYEEYFNVNLPYRDVLVTGNAMIDYFLYKDSSTEDVIIGKEHWLFFAPTIADYQKTNLYTMEQMNIIVANMEYMRCYFEERGMEFYIYIAPNKATIYGEKYLPERIAAGEGVSRTEQLVEYITKNSEVDIIFGKKMLQEACEEYPDEELYHHLDTHWNYLGGYYGAKDLLNKMGVELPERSEINVKKNAVPTMQWSGFDLANMLGLTEVLKKDVNYDISGYTLNEAVFEGDASIDSEAFSTISRSTSNATDDRKLFFIRDSFGTAMLPYLATSFREVYSPHQYCISLSMIEQECPDIVVLEMVERSDLAGFAIPWWDR